jgi:hypothetical protein
LIATAQEKFVKECSSTEPANACQGEILDASEVHILAISATDGMIDYLPLEQIAYVFAASMFVHENSNNPHPLTAAEYLILTAAEYWQQEYQGEYRDDIAVAAVKVLRRQNRPQANDYDSAPSTTKKASSAKQEDENTLLLGEEL